MCVRTWAQFLGQNAVLGLIRELLHVFHFSTGFLSFSYQLVEFGIHGVVAAQKRVYLVLFDWETRLDRLLTSPIFPVSFALHKNLDKQS